MSSSDDDKQKQTATAAPSTSTDPKIEKKPRTIFSLKSKSAASRDRYSQKANDYLETHKMQIYLQDAIKIILDRKDEKPLDLLNEYFNTTIKGEHILLREYAFVSATQLNRRSFL
jgi:hypothetical protein